jgi:two-component system LytT family sensor kinase
MLTDSSLRDPVLINTIGHTAGILLFGFIVLLLIRDWRSHGVRQTKLSLAAAALALSWNVGSLIALALPKSDSWFTELVMTASFAVLSLLPAVLLEVALRGTQRRIVMGGYVVSVCAVALHFGEVADQGIGLHQAALVVIAAGFGVLTATAFVTRRRQAAGTRIDTWEWVSLACLLLFSSSFLHFGYQHVSSPWAAEITWHHIGIPLALIVLLQDYRFLLLDTFVRFLVNAGLATLYVAILLIVNRRFDWPDIVETGSFLTGLALVALCLSLVLFAYLRNALQIWLSRVIFRRRNVEECVQAIVNLASTAPTEDELLERTAAEVGRHLRTEHIAVQTEAYSGAERKQPSVLFGGVIPGGDFLAGAQIPLRFSSGNARYLVAGARRGGSRYLSEDIEDMRRLATVIVEQVERFRTEELRRLVSQAELRALQAQINPHFLFNALNTLYGTIDRRSQKARQMVLNLADIFRYFLESERSQISLSEELRIIEAYLEIEKLRLGPRLQYELHVSEAALGAMIPILCIQPLVENAVKHGIAAQPTPGQVVVRAECRENSLFIQVEDTGAGFEASGARTQSGTGVGLENVRRRLVLSYGPRASLTIHSSDERTTVALSIPATYVGTAGQDRIEVPA